MKVILPFHPKEYRIQKLTYCGAYNVHHILQAYGFTPPLHPKDLQTHWYAKTFGGSPSKNYYGEIMQSYGLKAEINNADDLSETEQIDLCKDLLNNGNPVLLNVGSYFSATTGKWTPIKGFLMKHWITLWGYDDTEEIFYVYDPRATDANPSGLPIGNTTRSYKTIVKIWGGGMTAWAVLGRRAYYTINR
jgi:hypothetical protein